MNYAIQTAMSTQWWRHEMEIFRHDWPFVRGIANSLEVEVVDFFYLNSIYNKSLELSADDTKLIIYEKNTVRNSHLK